MDVDNVTMRNFIYANAFEHLVKELESILKSESELLEEMAYKDIPLEILQLLNVETDIAIFDQIRQEF